MFYGVLPHIFDFCPSVMILSELVGAYMGQFIDGEKNKDSNDIHAGHCTSESKETYFNRNLCFSICNPLHT